MLKVDEVILEMEQIEEAFEDQEVKFSKAKVNKLKKLLVEMEPDLKERLEEAFLEFIGEVISEEWGE
jgi:hypothetical protein